MFWSEQQQRNAEALADRARQRDSHVRLGFMTVEEAAKDIAPIEWLVEYERKADARKAAWDSSPFAGAVTRVVR